MRKQTNGGEGVGRNRNPERDLSLQRYMEGNGEISLDELAAAAGVPKSRISKWKSEDRWEEQLKCKPRNKGGQRGNKNAAGRTPAKEGNKNAVTHGAYAKAGYDDIPAEAAAAIKSIKPGSSLDRMVEELQSLLVRKEYLEGLLETYTSEEAQGEYYTDKIVHMIVPKSVDERMQEQDAGLEATKAEDPEGKEEQLKTAMKSVIKSSAFDRAMKVEAELNRLHGRIIKQIDSIKTYEMEDRRMTLEEKKYILAKQKLSGVYDFDDETDEIIDEIVDH